MTDDSTRPSPRKAPIPASERKGWTALNNAILYDKSLSHGAKTIYMGMRDLVRPDNGIDEKVIGFSWFEKNMGIGSTSMQRYIAELEAKGLILITRGEGKRHKYALGSRGKPFWDGQEWTEPKKVEAQPNPKKAGSEKLPNPKKGRLAPNPTQKSATGYEEEVLEEGIKIKCQYKTPAARGRKKNHGGDSPRKDLPPDVSTWNARDFVNYWEALADELGLGLLGTHKSMLGKHFKKALVKGEKPQILLCAVDWYLRSGDRISDRRPGVAAALDFCRHGTYTVALVNGRRIHDQEERSRKAEETRQRREVEKRQRLRRRRAQVARKANPDVSRIRRARATMRQQEEQGIPRPRNRMGSPEEHLARYRALRDNPSDIR